MVFVSRSLLAESSAAHFGERLQGDKMTDVQNLEHEKLLAAREAVKFVKENQIIGLGTGSTAKYAVEEIGKLVADGMKLKAVATSNQTAELAEALNIKSVSPDEVEMIDLTIDGADEFDAKLNLIKGGGGALFREKMVARLSKKVIIITDSTKKVETLGAFKVPVEVVPIAVSFAEKQIEKIGGKTILRKSNGEVFITGAGNKILDADFGLIENVFEISDKLNSIEGVVCHGLFINLAQIVIMGKDSETIVYEK
jgi:ribose 5-phosphate isomerase A